MPAPEASTLTPSRRTLVSGLALAAGAGTAGSVLGAVPAHAATYQVNPYTKTKVPTDVELHILNRFTYGYNPALLTQVRGKKDIAAWFDAQLNGGYDDVAYNTTMGWWPSLKRTPTQIMTRMLNNTEPFWVVDVGYAGWVLVRRLQSKRQVLEIVTEFFEGHLHVPLNSLYSPFRPDYGKVIRANALGTFEALLKAAVLHPAMQYYLTNTNSSKTAPNENLARELLELHTVGEGHFTEDDVKDSARILTGYRLNGVTLTYDPAHHATGPVKVLGFTHANSAADGRACLNAYLTYLAKHPLTAKHIARKLALRFVSDNPSQALVDHLAGVYLANNTAIKPVLKALIAHPEFLGSAGKKIRTSTDDTVATLRALQIGISRPSKTLDGGGAFGIVTISGELGGTPFLWPRPDGPPLDNASWSSPTRFLASLYAHTMLASRAYPYKGAVYKTPSYWLPVWSMRFDQLVDHLSRTLLGRPSTPKLLQAAVEATGYAPSTTINKSHKLVTQQMPYLLTVILDNPTHMSR